MGDLNRRLSRLSTIYGPPACDTCIKGWVRVDIVDSASATPLPTPCPNCGRASSKLVVVHIVAPEPDPDENPRVLT